MSHIDQSKHDAVESLRRAHDGALRGFGGKVTIYVTTEYTRSSNRRCTAFTIDAENAAPRWLMGALSVVSGRRLHRKGPRVALMMSGGNYNAAYEVADDFARALGLPVTLLNIEEL